MISCRARCPCHVCNLREIDLKKCSLRHTPHIFVNDIVEASWRSTETFAYPCRHEIIRISRLTCIRAPSGALASARRADKEADHETVHDTELAVSSAGRLFAGLDLNEETPRNRMMPARLRVRDILASRAAASAGCVRGTAPSDWRHQGAGS